MAGTQWENLPEPLPERPAPSLNASWQGFTVDPRPPANQVLRAADADRDYAIRLIEQARLDGRLSSAEHDDRAAGAGAARTLGELVPLVSDLMLPAAAGHHGRHKRFTQAGAMGWIGLALVFNAIWLMTSISAARPLYYWPMWPMFFIGLPLVMSMFASRRSEPPPPPQGQRQLPPGQDLR